ncbi:hypothetical protein BofuT4_uP090260.1 [Botrytis cinerea T4]|uniref:Uncharacterized protein n=1 Tax=Botryotinia fuckeliana (strain T4) TaxID=999810 RepID=G2YEU6_BOTF4|nr:hypothetical protein BofuT4_uP090260.1 [Botrytis cinerea T4]
MYYPEEAKRRLGKRQKTRSAMIVKKVSHSKTYRLY